MGAQVSPQVAALYEPAPDDDAATAERKDRVRARVMDAQAAGMPDWAILHQHAAFERAQQREGARD